MMRQRKKKSVEITKPRKSVEKSKQKEEYVRDNEGNEKQGETF